jgi:hypothetical protein
MSERIFKYRQPTNTDESISAIYEEISLSPKENNRQPLETLKDYVVALLTHSKNVQSTNNRLKEQEKESYSFALYTLGFIALTFLYFGWWSKPSDWEWLDKYRFTTRLWGITFAAIYVGITIENSSLFEKLWKFGFTKIVTSVAVSALLVFSTGKASSLINAVFGVDASAFPFTRAYVAGILAFQYASPLLIVVGVFAVIYSFNVIGYLKSKLIESYNYDRPPWDSILFLVLSIVVLIFSWQWINRDFSEATYSSKIYRLAHILDFNSKHLCSNLKEGISVVFIGSDQSRALVDMSGIQTSNIESLVNSNISGIVNIPKTFFFMECIVGTNL